MFERAQTLFLYALTPVHLGAGSQVGPVDNPIQREKHTGWPKANSTSLRGAIRRVLKGQEGWEGGQVDQALGPEAGGSDLFQAAVGIGDAMVLLFPVRSARHAFVYATCPAVLAAFWRRMHDITGEAQDPELKVPPLLQGGPARGTCWPLSGGPQSANDGGPAVLLEAFLLACDEQAADSHLAQWAAWIATYAFPASPGYFVKKVGHDLVLLHDDDFAYFARRSTLVEAHNRIEDASGTVAKGGLFYVEQLPPECLLATWVDASASKAPKQEGAPPPDAGGWLGKVRGALDGMTLQVGGDATTGRGLLHPRFLTKVPSPGRREGGGA
jgi:CRISPR-associated protein Cmr4